MRVSSSAPAMSRRSMMQGLAFALAGASVPVAAIAGFSASKLTAGPDVEIFNACKEWRARRRELRKMAKELTRLEKEAKAKEPPVPPELFEKIRIRGNLVESPYLFWPPEPWSKDRLVNILARNGVRSDGSDVDVVFVPSDECKAYAQRLLDTIEKRDAQIARNWRVAKRLNREWERGVDANDRLLRSILRTKAQTLHGVAAQIELMEADEYFSDAGAPDCRMVRLVLRNARQLIAQQSAA